MLTFENGLIISLVNAQLKWLLTQGVHRIKPPKTAAQKEDPFPFWVPNLSEEIFSGSGCWKKQDVPFQGVCLLAVFPCFCTCAHTHARMGNTGWTYQFSQRKKLLIANKQIINKLQMSSFQMKLEGGYFCEYGKLEEEKM